ncbi:MAG TPA: hypothetical protein VFF13_00255 [archaeon]|nr:hypothetical protein [archaeon]
MPKKRPGDRRNTNRTLSPENRIHFTEVPQFEILHSQKTSGFDKPTQANLLFGRSAGRSSTNQVESSDFLGYYEDRRKGITEQRKNKHERRKFDKGTSQAGEQRRSAPNKRINK